MPRSGTEWPREYDLPDAAEAVASASSSRARSSSAASSISPDISPRPAEADDVRVRPSSGVDASRVLRMRSRARVRALVVPRRGRDRIPPRTVQCPDCNRESTKNARAMALLLCKQPCCPICSCGRRGGRCNGLYHKCHDVTHAWCDAFFGSSDRRWFIDLPCDQTSSTSVASVSMSASFA